MFSPEWGVSQPMNVRCPSCGALIALADMNASTDVALCRACEEVHSLAGLLARLPLNVDLTAPDGAWYEERADGFDAGASTRSPVAFFLVPFGLVWISGVFFASTAAGQRPNADPLGGLFFVPFYLGVVALIAMMAMHVAGEVRLSRYGDDFTVFTGVGPVGWRRSYSWNGFRRASETFSTYNRRGKLIALEGVTRAAFGSMLSEPRRYFLLQLLRRELAKTRN